jgi:hypothetical protein
LLCRALPELEERKREDAHHAGYLWLPLILLVLNFKNQIQRREMMRFVQLHHSLTLLFVSSRMKAQSVNPDHHLKVKPTYAEKSS